MRWFRKNPSLGSLGPKGTLLLFGVLAVPASVLMAGRSVPALDPVFESPRFHLLVVSGIAACALVLALAAAVAAGPFPYAAAEAELSAAITSGELKAHVYRLASPEFRGRSLFCCWDLDWSRWPPRGSGASQERCKGSCIVRAHRH